MPQRLKLEENYPRDFGIVARVEPPMRAGDDVIVVAINKASWDDMVLALAKEEAFCLRPALSWRQHSPQTQREYLGRAARMLRVVFNLSFEWTPNVEP